MFVLLELLSKLDRQNYNYSKLCMNVFHVSRQNVRYHIYIGAVADEKGAF